MKADGQYNQRMPHMLKQLTPHCRYFLLSVWVNSLLNSKTWRTWGESKGAGKGISVALTPTPLNLVPSTGGREPWERGCHSTLYYFFIFLRNRDKDDGHGRTHIVKQLSPAPLHMPTLQAIKNLLWGTQSASCLNPSLSLPQLVSRQYADLECECRPLFCRHTTSR